MKAKQLLQQKSGNSQNLIVNGDFTQWPSGELIECDGSSKYFAKQWFGRRGKFAKNLIVEKISIPETIKGVMRISRKQNDTQTNEIAVSQVISIPENLDLTGKTLVFKASIKAGSGYSAPDKQLFMKILYSTANKGISKTNPFSLGEKSQELTNLKINLTSQDWMKFTTCAYIPTSIKHIMVCFRTGELASNSAASNDFFELMDVELLVENKQQTQQISTTQVPIFHVASMARSGETVFLRSLNAHPQIHNLVNLEEKDTSEEHQLFLYLKYHPDKQVSIDHPLVKKLNINSEQILLLKQGVWEHRHPFQGLVLVRNPISVYASMISYNAVSTDDIDKRKNALTRNCKRWLEDIDPRLKKSFDYLNDVEQFCAFYNRRMYPLSQLKIPIIHYEFFCKKPDEYLRKILKYFSLEYNESVSKSHLNYHKGQQGHGLIELSRPINKNSLDKWKNYVNQKDFHRIAALTYNTWKSFGYNITWPNISVDSSFIWVDKDT